MSAAAANAIAQPRDTIPALTGVRAYAAIWVMLFHLQIGLVPLGPIIARGYWAVDIFFVLSGFILSLIYAHRFEQTTRWSDYRSYLAARFSRIYPLHLVTLGVLAIYVFGHAALHPGTQLGRALDVRSFVANLSLLHAWGRLDHLSWNYPSWSVSAEWFAYLTMLPLLARGLYKAPVWAVLLLGLAAWTARYLILLQTGGYTGEQSGAWPLPRIVIEFSLGYGLYRLYLARRASAAVADALVVAGIAGILALCVAPALYEWGLALAVGGLIFGLARPGAIGTALFANRYAVYWGDRSYSIYMLHAVVQFFVNLLLRHFGALHPPGLWAVAMLLTEVAAVLTGSALAYRWIELPARAWLRDLLAARAPAHPAVAPA